MSVSPQLSVTWTVFLTHISYEEFHSKSIHYYTSLQLTFMLCSPKDTRQSCILLVKLLACFNPHCCHDILGYMWVWPLWLRHYCKSLKIGVGWDSGLYLCWQPFDLTISYLNPTTIKMGLSEEQSKHIQLSKNWTISFFSRG